MARYTRPHRRSARLLQRDRTHDAYHEAGHVVRADWLDLPVRAVSIVPDATTFRFGRIPRPPWWTTARSSYLTLYQEGILQRRAMMAMAGAAALGIHLGHTGQHTWHATGADRVVIQEELELLTGGQAEETEALLRWL